MQLTFRAEADYLANTVPVVATDVANMAELVGDAGRIVPAGNPDALATALDHVAQGTTSSATLARHAGARAARFTADAHAGRCLEIYQQVLERPIRTPA